MTILKPSTTETSSGAALAVDLDAGLVAPFVVNRYLDAVLDVTAASVASEGQPIVVSVDSAPSASGPWLECGRAEVTGPGALSLAAVAYGRFVRVRWFVVSGDSITFALTAESSQVFADLRTLYESGLSEESLRNVPLTVQARALKTATGTAWSKLTLRFDPPIYAVGEDVAEAVAKIAGYNLLSVPKGFNPDGNDSNVRTRYADAMKWLDDVADSHANPVGLIDSTPLVEDDGIAVVTDAPRWSRW